MSHLNYWIFDKPARATALIDAAIAATVINQNEGAARHALMAAAALDEDERMPWLTFDAAQELFCKLYSRDAGGSPEEAMSAWPCGAPEMSLPKQFVAAIAGYVAGQTLHIRLYRKNPLTYHQG